MKNISLDRQIKSILSHTSPTQFRIQLTVKDRDNKFQIRPYELESFLIYHDYVNNYTGKIIASWDISSADYATIYDHRNSLIVTVKHIYLDNQGHALTNPKPIVKTYTAVINDPHDIRKAIPDAHLRTTPDTRISLSLFEDAAYKLRFEKIHGTWVNTTIEQAMIACLNSWGIKKIHMSPSQNPHNFDHIVIPPYKEITNLFPFLQEKYGIYMNGISSYFYDDYFWVYPSHDTTSEYTHPQTLKIYKTDQGFSAGLTSYHRRDSQNSTSLAINSQPKMSDRSQLASEDFGTGVMFLRSSEAIDGIVNQMNGKITYNNQNAVIVNNRVNTLANPKHTNIVYTHQTDNLHQTASSLSQEQNISTELHWPMADPFLVEPGMKIVYYYDHSGKIAKREGILTAAVFEFIRPRSKGGRVNGQVMFQTLGTLQILLSPHEDVSDRIT